MLPRIPPQHTHMLLDYWRWWAHTIVCSFHCFIWSFGKQRMDWGKNEAEELKRLHLKIFQMCMLTPAGMESSSPTSLRWKSGLWKMDGWIWRICKMLVYVINSRRLQIVFFTSCTAGDQIPNDDNKEIMTPKRKDKVQRQNTYLKWSSDQGLLCENLDDPFVLCQYHWRDWLKTAQ